MSVGGPAREGEAGSISLKSALRGQVRSGGFGGGWARHQETDGKQRALRSREGFGLTVRQARVRPNTIIRDLLSDDRYAKAVLAFLRATRAGEIKERVS